MQDFILIGELSNASSSKFLSDQPQAGVVVCL